jgi:hypothetical protein
MFKQAYLVLIVTVCAEITLAQTPCYVTVDRPCIEILDRNDCRTQQGFPNPNRTCKYIGDECKRYHKRTSLDNQSYSDYELVPKNTAMAVDGFTNQLPGQPPMTSICGVSKPCRCERVEGIMTCVPYGEIEAFPFAVYVAYGNNGPCQGR